MLRPFAETSAADKWVFVFRSGRQLCKSEVGPAAGELGRIVDNQATGMEARARGQHCD